MLLNVEVPHATLPQRAVEGPLDLAVGDIVGQVLDKDVHGGGQPLCDEWRSVKVPRRTRRLVSVGG